MSVRVVSDKQRSNTRRILLVARPRVASFAPGGANVLGGRRVTVRGADFRSVRAVTFGGARGSGIRVASPSSLSVIAPRHAATAKPIELRVYTAYGASSSRDTLQRFTYQDVPSSRRVFPADSPTSGGRVVRVEGYDFVGVRAVRVGGKTAKIVSARPGEGSVDVLTPPHSSGSYDVVVQTVGGTSWPTAAAQVRYGPANPTKWSSASVIDPDPGDLPPTRGHLVDVSCSSNAFCAAVDAHGSALTRDATGTWSKPQKLSGSLRAISCPVDGYCVAVNVRQAFTLQDGTWSPLVVIDDRAVNDISCPTMTFCVAVDDDGRAVVRRDGTWEAPQAIVPATSKDRWLTAVSCPAPGECTALNWPTSVVTLTHDTWSAPTVLHKHLYGRTLTSLACSAPGVCLVGTNYGAVVSIDRGTTRETPHVIDSSVLTVACSAATRCVAASRARSAVLNGATWSASEPLPLPTPLLSSLSCAASSCTAVTRDAATTTSLP